MPAIFFIQKQGMYHHGVHGIFTDFQDAVEGCDTCAASDLDDYHDWVVIRAPAGSVSRHPDGEGFGSVSALGGPSELGMVVYKTKKPRETQP